MRSTTRVRSSRLSSLASCGPTPFSASTSVNSGLRISGRMPLLSGESAVAQYAEQKLADARTQLGRRPIEDSASARRQMGRGIAPKLKHEMIEIGAPRRAGIRWQLADRHGGMAHCSEGRRNVRRCILPPIIDEGVEPAARFDAMPPQGRDEDRIARLQLGNEGVAEGLGKARVSVQIGSGEIDHARRLPGHREVERADIEVGDLVRWKDGETTTAGNDAGEIVGFVEVRRDPAAIADPK